MQSIKPIKWGKFAYGLAFYWQQVKLDLTHKDFIQITQEKHSKSVPTCSEKEDLGVEGTALTDDFLCKWDREMLQEQKTNGKLRKMIS